jgi:Family of unknown function (DUF6178)
MNSSKDFSSSLELGEHIITSKNLAKKIFAAELPEQVIRTIPAQSLYLAIKRNSLPSSAELIEIASLEQVRVILDLDLWKKSYFDEDNFWTWLSLPDESDGLEILQKILKCIDLKLISLIISRHVTHSFSEEATEQPPTPNSFTPDKGRTWININIEDNDKHFLLGRLLAMIFETNADLFYQLLSITATTTQSILEEESYTDKKRRLNSEGIPDDEIAYTINTPISTDQAKRMLSENNTKITVADISSIQPLIYDNSIVQPLASLIADYAVREELEIGITHVMNAAIVRWQIELNDYNELLLLSQKVKGTINIGLEKALTLKPGDVLTIYRAMGVENIFRLGLGELLNLRKKVLSIKNTIKDESLVEQSKMLIINYACQAFPEIPEFAKEKDIVSLNELSTTRCAFEHLHELEFVCNSNLSFG